ncbi:transposase [Streptomyces sp. NPDC085946]|uniref:transposase n=1 Tax=Streptomyces sp. NPDC085946 TaxID=3365744 RepID=UPI0037D18683
MTPPRARTWGRRGQTPVIRVRGRSRRRTSAAVLCCYKSGEKSRLIHRSRAHLRLKGARRSFSWQDHRDLLVRAHIQLGGSIVVIWDNLNTHLAAGLKRYEAEHDWLTTIRLPPYAPDLNPVEAVWSLIRRAMANSEAMRTTVAVARAGPSEATSIARPVAASRHAMGRATRAHCADRHNCADRPAPGAEPAGPAGMWRRPRKRTLPLGML